MKYKSFSLVGFSSRLRQFSPEMPVLMRSLIRMFSFTFTIRMMGAMYYIDYNSGLSANGGTSTSSPWEGHPYTLGFSGTCSHSVGDQFILKGGVT